METYKRGLAEATGWLVFLSLLMVLALAVPKTVFDADSKDFILLIGAVGIWRYSMGGVHFLRGMLFLHVVYPYYRRRVRQLGSAADPSHVFLMVTSFRIDALTTAMVSSLGDPRSHRQRLPDHRGLLHRRDVRRGPGPFSVGEDEPAGPGQPRLRADSRHRQARRPGLWLPRDFRHLPDDDAVVAVIDGDTVLDHGVVKKTVPWFKLFPNVGGLTTNEFCEVQGGYVMSEWHKLRFAQRHINMCSMALSKRVLTMTGRMSVFRARVVTNPEFITDVENDHLEHWRLGRFKFLTGDDKSSWFSLMRLGYDTFYVPDAAINTVEHPPEKSFIKASRKLMYRWYGNNLRQNSRALKLGARRLGWFTMLVLFDQRVSMWTSLLGLVVAILASLKYSIAFLLVYLLWIGLTRLVLTLLLSLSGHRIGPAYPLILYYNQIVGALVKIYVFFRLDRQSWTRQPTKLERGLASFQRWFNAWSSRAMTFSAASIFVAVLLTIV